MTDLLDRARALLTEHPVVDGHNDLPWELRTEVAYDLDARDIELPQPSQHTDIPRLRAGGVGGQFWSVFVPSSSLGTLRMLYELGARYMTLTHNKNVP